MYDKYNLLYEKFRPSNFLKIPEPKFSPNHGNAFLSFAAGLDFSDDFTSYTTQGEADAVWVPQDIAKSRVNITNDNMDFDMVNDLSNNGIARDIGGVIDDTAWVLRAKIDIQGLGLPSSFSANQGWGIYDTNGATGGSSNQDFITQHFRNEASGSKQEYYTNDGDGVAPDAGVDTLFSRAMVVEIIFDEIIRTSATGYTVEQFSDAYSTSLESESSTVSSSTVNLQFVGFKNKTNADRTPGAFNGVLDDVFFFDGVTVAP